MTVTDFLIGVIGSKEDAEQVKQEVGCFIREKLHLEMSEEKTLITHGHDFAKFLGYEVTIAKGEYNKKTKTGATRRVNNGKVLLYVPHDKWVKRLLSYNALKIKYDIVARVVENYGRNSLIKRLQANKCEWCGAENVPLEIHHVRKLKDLSGRKQWEIAMIGRRRKTMALCIDCHDKLHAGKLD